MNMLSLTSTLYRISIISALINIAGVAFAIAVAATAFVTANDECPPSLPLAALVIAYAVRFSVIGAFVCARLASPSLMESDPFYMNNAAVAYKYAHAFIRGLALILTVIAVVVYAITAGDCHPHSLLPDAVLAFIVYDGAVLVIMIVTALIAVYFVGFGAVVAAILPAQTQVVSLELYTAPSAPPAPAARVDLLPMCSYQPGMFAADDRACAICLNEFANGEKLRVLLCAHHFHVECIDLWIQRRATCPMCVHPLRVNKGDDDLSALDIMRRSHNVSSTSQTIQTSTTSGGGDRDDDYAMRIPIEAAECDSDAIELIQS